MAYALTGFDGKVAVVTGAGRMRSIGRPIALGLAQAGCDVVLTGTGRAPATFPPDEQQASWRDIESVAQEIRALGRRALPIVSDVCAPEAVDALVAEVMAEMGRVDFLVNNAGASRGGDRVPVTELALDTWHRVMNINLNGTFYMSRAFAKAMGEQGQGGAIVNITSLAARLLAPDTAAYATTKIAINGLTTIMAGELGAKKIRVNAVAPGIIDTSRLDDVPKGDIWDGMVNSFIALGRAGTGEDVAHLVAFLCSDQGAWITGPHIYVDGGHSGTPRRPAPK
jgi:3-oxoacyl-[acyl-carrier protein] reductase/meso-butanediol dehydrogenase/(S,S)-butanediol dehydrogenase/diacetyl reductase